MAIVSESVAAVPVCPRQDPVRADQEAHALLKSLRTQQSSMTAAILAVPFLQDIQTGRLPKDRIIAMAAEQYWISRSDQPSFQLMANRWNGEPGSKPTGFFADLVKDEEPEQVALQAFYRALGLGFDQLRTYQPRPASQIYPGRVAVLAVAGDRASAAAALMINFPVFGKAMAKVQAGLMRHYGLTPSQISFVSFAAKPLPPSFEVEGLAEISRGLQEGACPHDVRTQVRLIQEAEFSFWKAASEPPGSRLEPLSSGRSGR